MGYGLVRALVRWVLALFYRRIDVVGLEHIPESRPLIVAANHQNALVDPMLLLALIPRRMVALATDDLVALQATDPEGAAQRLTERLSAALRREIVESEDRETHRLVTALESIARADAPAGARDAAARAEWMRGAMRAYRHLREREPRRVLRFRAEVERYLSDLGLSGLSD